MRVLMTDSALLSEKKKSGIGYYTQELKRGLRELAGDEVVFSFPDARVVRAHHWVHHQCSRLQTLEGRPGLPAWIEKKVRGKFLAVLRSKFPLLVNPFDVAVARSGCTLYHEPNFIPRPMPLPTVVSVHDLSVLRHPEWHPPQRVEAFEKDFHEGLKLARHLIAISEFGRSEIVDHLRWPADKVSVTYMGVRPGLRRLEGDELNRGLRSLGLRRGYLLHVGTIEPRKNVLMLLRAYCSLPDRVRERHPLVLAGGKGWNSDDVHAFLNDRGRHKNVHWLGYVADEHVAALYSGARALLFPTFYEGFGMPTIEMMACGGAVLASTAGAVAETAGKQAHLIDPNDVDGWRDAMARVCVEDDWLTHLRRGAEETARPFTWRRCAADTLDVYRRVAAENSSRVA